LFFFFRIYLFFWMSYPNSWSFHPRISFSSPGIQWFSLYSFAYLNPLWCHWLCWKLDFWILWHFNLHNILDSVIKELRDFEGVTLPSLSFMFLSCNFARFGGWGLNQSRISCEFQGYVHLKAFLICVFRTPAGLIRVLQPVGQAGFFSLHRTSSLCTQGQQTV
jgi:hypothetical protein